MLNTVEGLNIAYILFGSNITFCYAYYVGKYFIQTPYIQIMTLCALLYFVCQIIIKSETVILFNVFNIECMEWLVQVFLLKKNTCCYFVMLSPSKYFNHLIFILFCVHCYILCINNQSTLNLWHFLGYRATYISEDTYQSVWLHLHACKHKKYLNYTWRQKPCHWLTHKAHALYHLTIKSVLSPVRNDPIPLTLYVLSSKLHRTFACCLGTSSDEDCKE